MSDQEFSKLLARYPARYQPLTPFESLGGGGGLSGARLWRFLSPTGPLLLRAWPPDGPGRKHVAQVHGWLAKTAELGFVPVPIRDDSGQSFHEQRGTFWEVTPWIAGTPELSIRPTRHHLTLAFTGLALFHQRLSDEQTNGVSAGLGQRHHEIRQLIRVGFDTLQTAILGRSQSDVARNQLALSWLTLARNIAPALLEPLMRASGHVVRVQPIVRDARPEHFLFDGGRLSGIIDFGAMGVDSVAADLARLIGEWCDGDLMARREALDAYERVRPLDPTETGLIAVFEAGTALLIGERWVRWHYVEDRHFDQTQAVSSGLARGLNRLERLAGSGLAGW